MIRLIAAITISCLAALVLQGCRHPLAIVGEGDIVELNGSGRGCSLEQYRAQDAACVKNEVSGNYFVNYEARPRPGWRFVRWEGPCGRDSDFGHCRLQITADVVAQWEASDEGVQAPASTAVFQPVSGETGYLFAGTPVAGVAYTTPTQAGVTGLDGSFQYAEGERVRFAIGATELGEVVGKATVTPFDLAGSPVLRGVKIAWASRDENDPLNGVINLTLLLQSLDQDGNPGNGIVITRGVAELLTQVEPGLYQRVDDFGGFNDPEGGTRSVARRWQEFQEDPTLRHLLGRANREHGFSVAHWLARPAVAMNRLYQALGIDPLIVGLQNIQFRNEDGQHWERFAYDPEGYMTRHEISSFGNAWETWQYDKRGQVTLHEQTAEELNHHLVSISAHDSRGNLTHTETQFGGGVTQGGWRQEIASRYDRDSNLTRQESSRASEEGSESELSLYSYRYDNRGRLAEHIADVAQDYADGSSFHSVDYANFRYDATGVLRMNSRATDVNDVDGVPEQQRSWWYDAAGRVIRHESTFVSYPEEGDPDRLVWTWQYDTSGKMIRFADYNDVWLFRYQYDADGKATRRERVSARDGRVSDVTTWSYDDKAGQWAGS